MLTIYYFKPCILLLNPNSWCRFTPALSSVPIWLDDVSCSSSDDSLIGCSHSLSTSDCTHSEDVALVCTDGKYSKIQPL